MRHPVVLLDCDGPMARFTERYLETVSEVAHIHGIPHPAPTIADVTSWAIHECEFFKAIERRLPDLKKRVDARVSADGFCTSIEPCPQALVEVPKLMELATVYVVTAPWALGRTWMHEREEWCKKHFGIKTVIHTGIKHLIRGHAFIDDKPSHVEEWQSAWPFSSAFLFDLHHNRTPETNGIPRVDWGNIVTIIEELAVSL